MRPAIMVLESKYAKNGDVNIAYQVVGNGPLDLVFVMGWVSHLDYFWEEPRFARFLRRLATFSRLILFDKRGTGMSDPVSLHELPTLEQRMDDVRAVMDAVGSEQAALFGVSEGGPMCALFAATFPDRTLSLVMYGGYAKRIWSPDYPWAPSVEERQRFLSLIEDEWGTVVDLATLAPSVANDEQFRRWWIAYLRRCSSPGAALALARMNGEVDIRHVLPTIRVPTLILHRTGDLDCHVGGSRYMAEQIPDAKYIELPGTDHLPFVGDQDAIVDQIELFLTGVRGGRAPDRVLATVLAVDVIAAHERAAHLGDDRWSALRIAHEKLVHEELTRFHGELISAPSDGFMAAFDGPARAIRCANAIIKGSRRLGLKARAGLHTGEVEVTGEEIGGLAVHLAARVAAVAEPEEILVSHTVKNLVAGAGITFEPVGHQSLPMLPGAWTLFRVGDEERATLPVESLAERSVASAAKTTARLSRREQEIAALLARGLSNRLIAEELSISVGTVERHVANILGKLGFRSRAQVAAWAVEDGIQLHMTQGKTVDS